ncbi:MAG: ribosome maturation factor RimM, partial [Alphaproteobacteria bacterium]|nr:ribosome maturation factor RimM [Alphaproteobacteria bacterium]
VKLRSFTGEPEAIFTYGPLANEEGRVYKLALKSSGGDHFVVEVEGSVDREAAEALRGDRLYVPRDVLPKLAEREYFEADLIGLRASDAAGRTYGKIMAVHDHGAGVFLEIGTGKKDSFMLPFKDAFVPQINIAEGTAQVELPEGWRNTQKPRFGQHGDGATEEQDSEQE